MRLNKLYILFGGAIYFLIAILVLCIGEKSDRLIGNWGLLAIGLGLGTFLFFIFNLLRPQLQKLSNLKGFYVVIYLLILIIQLLCIKASYFWTGWDVGLMRGYINAIHAGETMQSIGADISYSIYPNNLLLFYLEYLLVGIGSFFQMKEPYLLCVYVSAFCVNVSCFIGNRIIGKLSGSKMLQMIYTVVGAVFICFSPWIIIPYSDTYGMLFVMLGIGALCLIEEFRMKWLLVSFAAILGYCIKPSCIFILFAVIMVKIPQYVLSIKKRYKELLALCCSILIFGGLSLGIRPWIEHFFQFELDENREMEYAHFMMMGFNVETNGLFNYDDVLFSLSFSDRSTRKEAEFQELKNRLLTYTKEQKAQLLKNKLMINFNSGDFAWGIEGDFYYERFVHYNIVYRICHEIFYPTGSYYRYFKTVMQGIWLVILAGIPLVAFSSRKREKNLDEIAVMVIVLCGLALFVMLFEARARYLYLYAPVFLIVALIGYQGILPRRWRDRDEKCDW